MGAENLRVNIVDIIKESRWIDDTTHSHHWISEERPFINGYIEIKWN
jgi:hypothetical protein